MSDIYSYDKNLEDQTEQTMIKADIGKRKKEQIVENLREGDSVNDIFAVKSKRPPRAYKKGTWFNFIAIDRTGEIGVKYWGGENKDRVKRLYDSFNIGDVIQIRSGTVEIYDDKPEISINEKTGGIRRCSPDEYDIKEFTPSLSDEDINKYFKEIKKEIENLENNYLKKLLTNFFNDRKIVHEFKHAPSAITHHHNYVGGNLEHTVGVIRLCKKICEMYTQINRDLVVTGAILHDIGKLREYETTAAIDKTEIGNFIGHIVIGDRWIREKIEDLKNNGEEFDKNLENQLCHMILSHHGKYEYGSPRIPKTVEACVLHQADLMDSQVKNYIQGIEDGRKNTDNDWSFIWDSNLGKKRLMFLGEI
jgi:3'-5' exoribonuclease